MTIIKSIKTFFIFLWHKLTGKITDLEIEDINDELERAIIQQKLDRKLLEKDVYLFLNKNYGYKKSKFIKQRKFNNQKLATAATTKFGQRMEELDYYMDAQLNWK